MYDCVTRIRWLKKKVYVYTHSCSVSFLPARLPFHSFIMDTGTVLCDHVPTRRTIYDSANEVQNNHNTSQQFETVEFEMQKLGRNREFRRRPRTWKMTTLSSDLHLNTTPEIRRTKKVKTKYTCSYFVNMLQSCLKSTQCSLLLCLYFLYSCVVDKNYYYRRIINRTNVYTFFTLPFNITWWISISCV